MLTGTKSIHDVIFFPYLRRKDGGLPLAGMPSSDALFHAHLPLAEEIAGYANIPRARMDDVRAVPDLET